VQSFLEIAEYTMVLVSLKMRIVLEMVRKVLKLTDYETGLYCLRLPELATLPCDLGWS